MDEQSILRKLVEKKKEWDVCFGMFFDANVSLLFVGFRWFAHRSERYCHFGTNRCRPWCAGSSVQGGGLRTGGLCEGTQVAQEQRWQEGDCKLQERSATAVGGDSQECKSTFVELMLHRRLFLALNRHTPIYLGLYVLGSLFGRRKMEIG
jgi:hypothetical protein